MNHDSDTTPLTDDRAFLDGPPTIHMAPPRRRRRSFGRAAAVMALLGCALGLGVGTTVSIAVSSDGRPAPAPRPGPAAQPVAPAAERTPQERAAARSALRRKALQRAMDAAPGKRRPTDGKVTSPRPARAPRIRVSLADVTWLPSGSAEEDAATDAPEAAVGVAEAFSLVAADALPGLALPDLSRSPLRAATARARVDATPHLGQVRLRALGVGALADAVPMGRAQVSLAADPQVALVRARLGLHERVGIVARTELRLGDAPSPGVGLVAVPVVGRRLALAVGVEAAMPPPGDLAADGSLRLLAGLGPLELGLGGLARVSAAEVAPAGLFTVDWPLGWITPMGELAASRTAGQVAGEGALGLAVDPAAPWQLAAWWTWRGGPGFRLGVTWTAPARGTEPTAR